MKTLICDIKDSIEHELDKGNRKFIIFPFGEVGMQVKYILEGAYGIAAEYILDNNLCKYNDKIKPLSFLKDIDCKPYVIILASTNTGIYMELKHAVLNYFEETGIAELACMQNIYQVRSSKVGKYSYGPLCNHYLVESVGAFCSFAPGTDVVVNHSIDYISTHPFIFYDSKVNPVFHYEWDEHSEGKGECYMEGVKPHGKVHKSRRIVIGNDVWLGRNVIITNGANIGNGVIAGAGAIITKNVPDYAVVVGAPARIIRYRYAQNQIVALNQIQWWNWSDDEIRERYDDFYLPVEEFIHKYWKRSS